MCAWERSVLPSGDMAIYIRIAVVFLIVMVVASNAAPEALAYKKLLASSAGLYGKVEKGGMLPLHYWSENHFNKTHAEKFHHWLHSSIAGNTSTPKIPPLTHICGVWVNHAYKVIFIRNKKAASTSIVTALGNPCRGKSKKTCMDKVEGLEAFQRAGITPQDAWRDYTVFGVARNPWARAASGFDYAAIAHGKEHCFPHPDFKEFCQDPLVLGKRCYQNQKCCFGYIGKLIHLEPAARCFMTPDGKPVVDYIVRYENLQEDFDKVIDMLNKKRDPNSKPLKSSLTFKTVGPQAAHLKSKASDKPDTMDWDKIESSARHAEKYAKCGMSCVDSIGEFYKEDVEFFKYNPEKIMGE